MTEEMDGNDLTERVKLIESMMAAGRRGTESWGWTFVLWGMAYYVAMAWAAWGNSNLAWPVTMSAAAVVTAIVASRKARKQPRTTIGRAVGSVWAAVGISMFVLLLALGMSGFLETRVFMGILAAMLATANAASAMILKWKVQVGCTLIWWATCWICADGTPRQATITLLAAIFLCQIVFGAYSMALESRRRSQGEVVHA
ncbi:MAG: hypothetical protein WCC14_03990 [Acidobacteriaceae bacterium]